MSTIPLFIRQGSQVGGTIAGGSAGTIIGSAGSGAATGLGAALAGTAAASAATIGAVTFGLGAVLGIGLSLWAKHKARAAGAKNENQRLNIIIPGFNQSLQQIFAQLNAGKISPQTAVQAIAELEASVEQDIAAGIGAPGTHAAPNPPPITGKYWQLPISKSVTAGSFLEHNFVRPAAFNAVLLIVAPNKILQGPYTGAYSNGTLWIPQTYSSKYGFVATPAYTLHYIQQQQPQPGPIGFSGNNTAPVSTATPVSAITDATNTGTTQPQKASKAPLYAAGALVAAKVLGFL